MAIIKGQNVKLMSGSSVILQKETSCSLSFQVNTMDESCKTDTDPDYEKSAYDNTELSASVEGNLADAAEMKALLTAMQGNGINMKCEATIGSAVYGTVVPGTSVIVATNAAAKPTSLEIDMPAEGLATVSMSLEIGSDFEIDTN